MRIFVTGGTGFIGTHFVKKLQERGHNLYLLKSDLAETEKWQEEIKDFNPDACVHLAWEGLPDYSIENSRKNINYSLDLLTFLTKIGCKTVLSVGSAWEYEGRDPKGAIDGIIIIKKPADVFSVAKWIVNLWGTAVAEEKNKEIDASEKFKFIWARIFFVYGPGQRETSLIPYLINCAKKGEKPTIKNPLAQNDYIYIDDVVEAIAVLLENCKESAEYEIGRGELITNQEIVNIIAKKFGIKDWERPIIKTKEKIPLSRPAYISKLESLDWKPKVSLEEGIPKMIDFYLSK